MKDARVAGEPAQHLGMLVSSVVVEDDVDHLAGRHRALDGVEEADEFLVPVALHAWADDGAVEHVEGGEQGRGAVAFVVQGQGARFALFHGQARRGPIERLDLAFLVHGQHDRMGRRIDVQTDDVTIAPSRARSSAATSTSTPLRIRPQYHTLPPIGNPMIASLH